MGWGDDKRAGWVKAPRDIELEIRSVWQEDEMPAELKDDPNYLPFTLGLAAQDWVDSMSEIVDGGKAIYGRPKPPVPTQHRSLTTPPPAPTPQPPAPSHTSSPSSPTPRVPSYTPDTHPGYWPSPPREARVLMPDIDDARPASAPPPRTLPKRVVMPDIPDVEAPPPKKAPVGMPDIDSSRESRSRKSPPAPGPPAPQRRRGAAEMPNIGSDNTAPVRSPSMPDIGDAPPVKPKPAKASMPDVGESDEHDKRSKATPLMPDIG